MGAPTRPPPHLCRLLLPAGVFLLLLLLYLSSPRQLLRLPPLACIGGPRPTFGEEDQEGKGTARTTADSGARPRDPTRAPALLPAATSQLPPAPLPPTPGGPEGQGGPEFQILRLWSAFAASITPDGQLLLEEYLRGWDELMKLMDALGGAFRLASAEAGSKTALLRGLLRGRHGRHYATLRAMVAFERGGGGGGAAGGVAAGAGGRGLRTLLRLHRALRWLQLFLRSLAEGGGAGGAAEAYREALAPFHAWWVRRAAALAFLALPARDELLRLACAGAGPGARDVLRGTVRALERVCNVTQEVYAAHGLLELP